MNISDAMRTAANQAYEDYDFGDCRVTDAEGWTTGLDPLDMTRIVYVEDDEGSGRVSFHVRFNEHGEIVEVYGLDMQSGGYVGTCPVIYVVSAKDGHSYAIDTRRLSRDRGFVALVIEINGGTQYALVTDVIDAMKKVAEAGGKVVDATTDFEELINGQYGGFAVLTTEMS